MDENQQYETPRQRQMNLKVPAAVHEAVQVYSVRSRIPLQKIFEQALVEYLTLHPLAEPEPLPEQPQDPLGEFVEGE